MIKMAKHQKTNRSMPCKDWKKSGLEMA
jgi:hypothetical protein